MEDNKTTTVENKTTENTTENTNEATQEGKKVENTEKTFTQKELDEIIKTRLAKAEKGYPSKEELKSFNEWKESQKTEAEKQVEKEKENQKILEERNNLQRENLLLKKGVKDDDIDYVMFKVSKQKGNFEENLAQFLKDNPKFLNSYNEVPRTIDLGDKHSNNLDNEPSYLISALKQKYNK